MKQHYTRNNNKLKQRRSNFVHVSLKITVYANCEHLSVEMEFAIFILCFNRLG